MKKNILLLINGFGIEQKDSVSIYSQNLMPNLDKLTKIGMFGSLSSNDLDYKDGYRRFSIGINEALTYSIVNNSLNDDSYIKNEILKYIIRDHNNTNGKIHIICYFDNENTIYQLTSYIKHLVENTTCNIFIHFILRNKSLKNYKSIEKCINNINYEYGVLVKVGIIVGENNLNNPLSMKDFIKMLTIESGERWKEINKKLSVLIDSKTIPTEIRTFAFNSGFGLSENDSIIFFNYNNLDVTPYTKELIVQKYKQINLSTIKFYSLFPVKCDNVQIPHLFEYGVSSTYALASLRTINAKCIIMDKKDKCNDINYYMTGLRNNMDESLRYMPTDNGFIYDSNTLINTINSLSQELIIVNYEIDDCKTVEEIMDRLKKIDVVIGSLYEFATNNNHGLFISSLYGIEKEMYNNKHILCPVNFSTRVPAIIVDKSLTKAVYSFNEGTVYDLSNTIFYNINNAFKNSGLLKKKSTLSKMFHK